MIKAFLGLVCIWVLGLGTIAAHYASYDRDSHKEQLSGLVAVTGITSPSLSSAFYEPRVLGEASSNPLHPSMDTINKMDFVYAK